MSLLPVVQELLKLVETMTLKEQESKTSSAEEEVPKSPSPEVEGEVRAPELDPAEMSVGQLEWTMAREQKKLDDLVALASKKLRETQANPSTGVLPENWEAKVSAYEKEKIDRRVQIDKIREDLLQAKADKNPPPPNVPDMPPGVNHSGNAELHRLVAERGATTQKEVNQIARELSAKRMVAAMLKEQEALAAKAAEREREKKEGKQPMEVEASASKETPSADPSATDSKSEGGPSGSKESQDPENGHVAAPKVDSMVGKAFYDAPLTGEALVARGRASLLSTCPGPEKSVYMQIIQKGTLKYWEPSNEKTFKEWMSDSLKVIEAMDLKEERGVRLLIMFLRNGPDLYFQGYEEAELRRGGNPYTYAFFREVMMRAHGARSDERNAYTAYEGMSYRNHRSVTEMVSAMRENIANMKASVRPTEAQMIEKFLARCDPRLSVHLAGSVPWENFEALAELAIEKQDALPKEGKPVGGGSNAGTEKGWERPRKGKSKRPYKDALTGGAGSANGSGSGQVSGRSSDSGSGRAEKHPRTGVAAKLTPSERARLKDSGACYLCKEVGHRVRDCPKATKEQKDHKSVSFAKGSKKE
jgi:hypothetical protein